MVEIKGTVMAIKVNARGVEKGQGKRNVRQQDALPPGLHALSSMYADLRNFNDDGIMTLMVSMLVTTTLQHTI